MMKPTLAALFIALLAVEAVVGIHIYLGRMCAGNHNCLEDSEICHQGRCALRKNLNEPGDFVGRRCSKNGECPWNEHCSAQGRCVFHKTSNELAANSHPRKCHNNKDCDDVWVCMHGHCVHPHQNEEEEMY